MRIIRNILFCMCFSFPVFSKLPFQGQFTFDAGISKQGIGYGLGVSIYNEKIGADFGFFTDSTMGIAKTDPYYFTEDLEFQGTEKHLDNFRLGMNLKNGTNRFHFGGFIEKTYTFNIYKGEVGHENKNYYEKINTETEIGAYLGITRSYKYFVYGVNVFSSGTAMASAGFEF